MLTPWEIRDALGRITYKDWAITVEHDEFIGPKLRVVFSEDDNFNPGKTIDIGFGRPFPPLQNEQALFDMVLHRLIEAETHEVRERFLVDGRIYSDPHAVAA